MFDIGICGNCKKAVTPENRDTFAEVEGVLLCKDCRNAPAAANTADGNMAPIFDTLHETTIIQKRSDRDYAAASTIAEMIDVFEKRLASRNRKRFIRLLMAALFLGAVIGGIVWLGMQKAPKPGPHTDVPDDFPVLDTPLDPDGEGQQPDAAALDDTAAEDPAEPVEGDAAAKAEYQRLAGKLSSGGNLVSIRQEIVKAIADHGPSGDYAALLADIEKQISAEAEKDLQGLRFQIQEPLRAKAFNNAAGMVKEFSMRYDGTDWYQAVGRDQIEAIQGKINSARNDHFKSIMNKAVALTEAKKYPEAYTLYEEALLYAPPELRTDLDNRMKEVIALSGKTYGEAGLEGYIRWQKYCLFRQDYIYYVRMRELKSLKDFVADSLGQPEYQLIAELVQADRDDIVYVEQVIDAASRYLGGYVNKSHTINTQAGRITGTIKSVSEGILTVSTSNVDISIPISKLAVSELQNMVGQFTGEEADFHLGLGILYLADGNHKQARIEFNAAGSGGRDIKRYLEHIRAAESGDDEKEASAEYKKKQKP